MNPYYHAKYKIRSDDFHAIQYDVNDYVDLSAPISFQNRAEADTILRDIWIPN